MYEDARQDNRELDDAAIAVLESRFARLGLPDHPLWAEPDGAPVRWFGDRAVLLRDDGRSWLWAIARTHGRARPGPPVAAR